MIRNLFSPIPTIPFSLIPPTQNVQVNFYDPITGIPTGSVVPVSRTTYSYNKNGINVEITGTTEDIRKTVAILNMQNNQTQSTPNPPNFDNEVYPIDMPIEDIISRRRSQTNTQNFPNSNTSRQFSGSGVLIIEKNGTEPYLLLVKTINRGTYEDFGGNLDITMSNQITLNENAKKELLEESQNLFVCNTLELERQINGINTYVDIDDKNNGLYRCYILVINGTSSYDIPQFYSQNKLMTMNRMGYQSDDWKESIELRRFSLRNIKLILNTTQMGGINCTDVNNMSCTIRDRTANCLRKLFENNIFQVLYDNPVNVRYINDRTFNSLTIGMHIFRI